MRPETDRYYLHQIANQLGEDRHEQEENLLLLLIEGKLSAFVEDVNFQVRIPKLYWMYCPLSSFTLFLKNGVRGKELHLKPCEIVRIAFRKSLSTAEKQNKSEELRVYLERLIYAAHVGHEDEELIDEDTDLGLKSKNVNCEGNLPDIQALRKNLEESFINKLEVFPIYISRSSWIDYLNNNGYVSSNGSVIHESKAKRGRHSSEYWIKMLLYLIKCIMHNSGDKPLYTLLGIDKSRGSKAVAEKLSKWVSTVKDPKGENVPTMMSIYDKLGDLERNEMDLSVMFPPASESPKKSGK